MSYFDDALDDWLDDVDRDDYDIILGSAFTDSGEEEEEEEE